MYRIVLVISLFVIGHCAPSPFYTRSFVRTPTSQVEQYLIMPDKNDPYKVPMSQVHQFNEFKFPKQQVLYYNPKSQSSLQEMREDSPMWQSLMETMKQKSEESSMNKMDMMQASDAALENEMMENVDAMNSKLSQRETRLMTEAIMKGNSDAEMISKPIFIADDVNEKMTQDDAIREELMMGETMTEDMKQKAADLLEATEPQYDQEIMTELVEEQRFNDEQLKIMEMIKQFKLATEATPINTELSQRESKAMEVNEKLIESIKDSMTAENKSAPIEMLQLVEATSQKPSEMIVSEDSEMQQSLPIRVLAESDQIKSEPLELTSEKPKSMIEIMQEILKINEASLNVIEMMRFIEQTTTVAPALKEEVEQITESLRSDPQVEVKCNKTEPVMSSEVMKRIVELLSNIESATSTSSTDVSSTEDVIANEQLSSTSGEPKIMELEVVSSDDVQGEDMELRMVEVTTETIKEMPEDIEITSTERITSAELKILSSTEAIIIESESTTDASEVSSTNDESAAGTAEISSRNNGNENSSSEQESMEQAAVNVRQGRVNDSPTLFLHNNRFYVVSGAPEFYTNFDAYQKPRTPIFSLQELQAIRPEQTNVRVQKVEPFRIFVDEDTNENTQNVDDNKSKIEPLKLDDNEKDSQARDIEFQSMKSTVMEVKKPEQASADEDREFSDDSAVAVASPDAIGIAGIRGVASVRPKGIALTNERGLAVSSPQATAIAGDFNLDEFKNKRVQLRRMRKIRKL